MGKRKDSLSSHPERESSVETSIGVECQGVNGRNVARQRPNRRAEVENVNTDPSVSPPKPSAFSSASGEKLKNRQQEETEFDKDNLLTGFRFVDSELRVDFVKKLLCLACK